MGAILSVVKIDWVSAVKILALRRPVGIAGVNRPSVVGRVQHERVTVLAQSVQMRVLWQVCLEIDILTLEHQLVARGIEEHLTGVSPRYGEREGVSVEFELELGVLRGTPLTKTGAWEDTVWNLVDRVVGVQDLDVESIAGLVLHLQLQVWKVSPENIACRPCEREFRVKARTSLPLFRRLVSWAFGQVLFVEVIAGAIEIFNTSLALSPGAATQGCSRSEQLLEIHEALNSEQFHVRIRPLYSSLDSHSVPFQDLPRWTLLSVRGL